MNKILKFFQNFYKKTETSLLDDYSNSIETQSLMQLVPNGYGSAVDVILQHRIEQLRKDRLTVFYKELSNNHIPLTEELIKSNEFLNAYFSTVKAVLATNNQSKIKLFANLLISGVISQNRNFEKHEQFLAILEELSFSELQILDLLFNIERKFSKIVTEGDQKEITDPIQKSGIYWQEFQQNVESTLGINSDILRSMLNRLNRTGLYENLVGMIFGYKGGRGHTTVLYNEFRLWVLQENISVIQKDNKRTY